MQKLLLPRNLALHLLRPPKQMNRRSKSKGPQHVFAAKETQCFLGRRKGTNGNFANRKNLGRMVWISNVMRHDLKTSTGKRVIRRLSSKVADALFCVACLFCLIHICLFWLLVCWFGSVWFCFAGSLH